MDQSDVIFLCETLVYAQRIEEIKVSLNYDYCFSVDCSRRSDGLTLFWKKPFRHNLVIFFLQISSFLKLIILENHVGASLAFMACRRELEEVIIGTY